MSNSFSVGVFEKVCFVLGVFVQKKFDPLKQGIITVNLTKGVHFLLFFSLQTL
jgi:hypothetical protein